MKIIVTSILVDDQDKAEKFYTDILGFKIKENVPMGHHRWLTLVEPTGTNPVEIVLEPSEHPASKPFREALVADGIPYTMLGTDDCEADYKRLSDLGVRFTQPPTNMGPVTTAVLDDTCGNLIMIAQRH